MACHLFRDEKPELGGSPGDALVPALVSLPSVLFVFLLVVRGLWLVVVAVMPTKPSIISYLRAITFIFIIFLTIHKLT